MTHAMAHKGNGSDLVGLAAIAALFGAAAALLLAPKSGRETRLDIKRKIHEAQERSQQKTTELKDAAANKAEQVRDKTSEIATDAEDAVTEARSQVEDAAAEMHPRTRPRRPTTL